jgi:hypothetical protein
MQVHYESEFLDRLVSDGMIEIARLFHASFRYIDDALSLDNPHWKEWAGKHYEDGGIYPRALVLNDTTLSEAANAVNYVGMEIRNKSDIAFTQLQRMQQARTANHELDYVYVNVFDKRKEFPFEVRRYPYMCSLIPVSITYGVFIGLLHRYHNICSDWKDFNSHAVEIARKLMERGCTAKRLHAQYEQFLWRKHANSTHPHTHTHSSYRNFRIRNLQKIMAQFKQAIMATI